MTTLEAAKDRVGAELVALGVDVDHLTLSIEDGRVNVVWTAMPGSHFSTTFMLDLTESFLLNPSVTQERGFTGAIQDISEKISHEADVYGEEICQFWELEAIPEGEASGDSQLFVRIQEMLDEAKVHLEQRFRVDAGRIVMTRQEFDAAKLEEVAAP